jgi:hypothetical protein
MKWINNRMHDDLSAARTANYDGSIIEYHPEIRLIHFYAFELIYIYFNLVAHSSLNDDAPVCESDFCAVPPQPRQPNDDGPDP